MADATFFHTPSTPVPILQRQDEFTELLARYVKRAPRRVVEVGTYHGGTLYHWLRLAKPGMVVVSVDSYDTGVDNRARYSAWTPDGVRCHALAGDSRDPSIADLASRLLGGPIKWLFLDAMHLDAGLRAEWAVWSPRMAKGGVAMIHDILNDPRHPELQCWRLWQELTATHKTETLISDPDQEDCGIGIVYF